MSAATIAAMLLNCIIIPEEKRRREELEKEEKDYDPLPHYDLTDVKHWDKDDDKAFAKFIFQSIWTTAVCWVGIFVICSLIHTTWSSMAIGFMLIFPAAMCIIAAFLWYQDDMTRSRKHKKLLKEQEKGKK